ncbi:hypothetical protein lpari_01872 [Legionella parisiensis]|uniref:Uncharacterized protein n=1 Tax=Legionella parisiensis TaxID=45071 RepID=A0A1E5JRE3_9GAMM|nr:hypothetical protein lpari_01872 [Legionella parisiensis]
MSDLVINSHTLSEDLSVDSSVLERLVHPAINPCQKGDLKKTQQSLMVLTDIVKTYHLEGVSSTILKKYRLRYMKEICLLLWEPLAQVSLL